MHNVIEVTNNSLAVRGRMENNFLCEFDVSVTVHHIYK